MSDTKVNYLRKNTHSQERKTKIVWLSVISSLSFMLFYYNILFSKLTTPTPLRLLRTSLRLILKNRNWGGVGTDPDRVSEEGVREHSGEGW